MTNQEDTTITQEDTAQRLMRAMSHFRRFNGKPQNIGGLTRGELMILFCVDGTTPSEIGLKVSEIGNRLAIASPTATQQITALENQGYVERTVDPNDRRVVRVRLTEKGAEATEYAKTRLREALRGLVEFLGEEDSNQLASLMERASDYFANLRESGSAQGE